MITTTRKVWALFGTIQLLGATLAYVGAEFSLVLQMLGIGILLPGSVPASWLANVLSHELPRHGAFGTLLGGDAEGLSNVVYLPLTILLNSLITLTVLYLCRRRGAGPTFQR